MARLLHDWIGPLVDVELPRCVAWRTNVKLEVDEPAATFDSQLYTPAYDHHGSHVRTDIRYFSQDGPQSVQVIDIIHARAPHTCILSDGHSKVFATLTNTAVDTLEAKGVKSMANFIVGIHIRLKQFRILASPHGDPLRRILFEIQQFDITVSTTNSHFGHPTFLVNRDSVKSALLHLETPLVGHTDAVMDKTAEQGRRSSHSSSSPSSSLSENTRGDESSANVLSTGDVARDGLPLLEPSTLASSAEDPWRDVETHRVFAIVPKDQRLLLDKRESFLPAEAGKRFPVPNLPVQVLESLAARRMETPPRDSAQAPQDDIETPGTLVSQWEKSSPIQPPGPRVEQLPPDSSAQGPSTPSSHHLHASASSPLAHSMRSTAASTASFRNRSLRAIQSPRFQTSQSAPFSSSSSRELVSTRAAMEGSDPRAGTRRMDVSALNPSKFPTSASPNSRHHSTISTLAATTPSKPSASVIHTPARLTDVVTSPPSEDMIAKPKIGEQPIGDDFDVASSLNMSKLRPRSEILSLLPSSHFSTQARIGSTDRVPLTSMEGVEHQDLRAQPAFSPRVEPTLHAGPSDLSGKRNREMAHLTSPLAKRTRPSKFNFSQDDPVSQDPVLALPAQKMAFIEELRSRDATLQRRNDAQAEHAPRNDLGATGADDTDKYGIYSKFRLAYSDYQGDQKHFEKICQLLRKLSESGQALHKSLMDDFVVRHFTDYRKYAIACLDEGEHPVHYIQFYHERVDEPSHMAKILNPDTLSNVLGQTHAGSHRPSAAISSRDVDDNPDETVYFTSSPARGTTLPHRSSYRASRRSSRSDRGSAIVSTRTAATHGTPSSSPQGSMSPAHSQKPTVVGSTEAAYGEGEAHHVISNNWFAKSPPALPANQQPTSSAECSIQEPETVMKRFVGDVLAHRAGRHNAFALAESNPSPNNRSHTRIDVLEWESLW